MDLVPQFRAQLCRFLDGTHAIRASLQASSRQYPLAARVFAYRSRLFDKRSSLLDTALHEFRLDLRFLARQQVHFGFKGAISGKLDLYPVLSGADSHGMKTSSQFAGMPEEGVVNEDGRAFRFDVHFQGGAGLRRWGCRSRRFFQLYANELNLPWLHN